MIRSGFYREFELAIWWCCFNIVTEIIPQKFLKSFGFNSNRISPSSAGNFLSQTSKTNYKFESFHEEPSFFREIWEVKLQPSLKTHLPKFGVNIEIHSLMKKKELELNS